MNKKLQPDMAPEVNEEKYPLEDIINNSEQALGVKKYVVVGATHGLNVRDLFTITEIKNLIKRFLGKVVN